ncbi:MAG TPA: hypothetical protein VMG10_05100 [Gemmataceae bacterium]|nr:hypothetical protein [Gemmataceae bacterium]
MKRVLLLTASFVLIASAAQAQYAPPGMPGYGGQSAMPYLNLLQPNINPTLTYAGIVQPQLQAQSMFQQMQSQINMTRVMAGGVAPPRNSGVADTGYAPARFMQYQQYFNTMYNARRPGSQTQSGTNLGFYGGR